MHLVSIPAGGSADAKTRTSVEGGVAGAVQSRRSTRVGANGTATSLANTLSAVDTGAQSRGSTPGDGAAVSRQPSTPRALAADSGEYSQTISYAARGSVVQSRASTAEYGVQSRASTAECGAQVGEDTLGHSRHVVYARAGTCGERPWQPRRTGAGMQSTSRGQGAPVMYGLGDGVMRPMHRWGPRTGSLQKMPVGWG